MNRIKLFRAEDWWLGKVSLLIGVVYIFAIYFRLGFDAFWFYTFWSFVTILGFAAFGYYVNDFFDQEKDRLVGKKNFLLSKSPISKAFYGIVAMALMLMPWLFLPNDNVSRALIAMQILSYFAYSVPPLRWKEKGAAGLITDACYAHALPTILAAHTFSLIAQHKIPLLAYVTLFLWQFLAGFRNVLLHQLDDQESDIQSRTRTFVYANNFLTGYDTALKVIAGAELIFLIITLFLFADQQVVFFFPVVALILPLLLRYTGVGSFGKYFPNIVYEQWLPYTCIAILIWFDTRFIILLLLHISLFSLPLLSGLYFQWRINVLWSKMKSAMSALVSHFKTLVNWTIYYIFKKIFVVDLIQEKTDAKGYILKKIKKQ